VSELKKVYKQAHLSKSNSKNNPLKKLIMKVNVHAVNFSVDGKLVGLFRKNG
jgi:hypothetical protein